VALAVASLVLYSGLTILVATGQTLGLDSRLMLAIATERRPWFSPLMYLASLIGGGEVAIPVALMFASSLWRRRRGQDARAYLIIALSGWAVYGLAKLSIRRSRPHVIPYLYHGAGWYSYPSGHSMLAPIVFGLAAVLWSAPWKSEGRRVAFIAAPRARCTWAGGGGGGRAAAALLSLTIAFSRVYLGVHYPSDAAGGLLLGLAWSSFWFWWWGTTVGEDVTKPARSSVPNAPA
jgi:undecaprenyl-diphosphatase